MQFLPLVSRRDKNPKIAFYANLSGSKDIYTIDARGENWSRLTDRPEKETDPAWSPDGGRIAYSVEIDPPGLSDGVSSGGPSHDIYIMNADGSGSEWLLTAVGYDAFPDWSPDGKKIVYASAVSGAAQIYTIDLDSREVTRLTDDDYFNAEPAWSPDGLQIAYTSYRDGALSDIYIMRSDGTQPIRLTDNGTDYSPDWSPDGQYIAYTSVREGDADIYLARPDGSGEFDLTRNSTPDFNPAWSSDGEWIAFCAASGPLNLFKIRSDGSERTQLTFYWGLQCDPAWAP